MRGLTLCIFALFMFMGLSQANADRGEVITDFHSLIVVNEDSTMTVSETTCLDVTSYGNAYGIDRDVPTRFEDRFGRIGK